MVWLGQLLTANYNGYALVALLLLLVGKRQWPAQAAQLLPLLNILLALGGLAEAGLFCYSLFSAYTGPDTFERFSFVNRYTGPYWWAALLQGLPLLLAQLFWRRRFRSSRLLVGLILLLMWAGLVAPVLSLLCASCLPSSWVMFTAPDVLLLQLLGYCTVVLCLYQWRLSCSQR